jgi:hypothetical protein
LLIARSTAETAMTTVMCRSARVLWYLCMRPSKLPCSFHQVPVPGRMLDVLRRHAHGFVDSVDGFLEAGRCEEGEAGVGPVSTDGAGELESR